MSHQDLADALRAAVAADTGVTDASLRTAIAAGSPVAEPYDTLARQIRDASHRVTDAEVAAVRDAAGSDKAAFEIVMSACVGAGLQRWDAFREAIDAAG
ncbi:MAG TPA: hypothetical protein VL652_05690 [Kutzneria sp.]|nr:hypothetical protein [Kutzneria sp.]